MKLYHHRMMSVIEGHDIGIVRDRINELSDTRVAQGDIFEELASEGRFDEQGGELSQADWDDVRVR